MKLKLSIINQSLNYSVFRNKHWKNSTVIEIKSKSSKIEIINYQPVSQLFNVQE